MFWKRRESMDLILIVSVNSSLPWVSLLSKGHIPLAAIADASTEKFCYSGALLPFFNAV